MKPQTNHIVCATDFSVNACGAADVAAAIAVRLGTQLVLVHVADQAHARTEGTKAFRAFLRPLKTRLHKEAQRLQRAGASVEEVLLHGKSAETAVVEFLEKIPPLLVLVSSVSKTNFDRWTIGSVSEYISQHSPAPTWVVRSPDRLLAWARQEGILKVVVAADFSINSDAALAWIKELRKIGTCVVTVAHINWPPDEHHWLAPGTAMPLTTNIPSVRRRLIRDLQRKIGDVLEGNVEVQVEPNWGRPDAALVQMAAEADADVIVVGTHRRQGFQRLTHPSISRGVLRHASMSVACVPLSPAMAHGVGHRPHIGRILVATDFSPTGDQAIPWAYAALGAGGVVKLMHVLAPRTLSKTRRGANPDQLTLADYHEVKTDAREKLTSLIPTQTGGETITTEVEVIVDRDPARAIGAIARTFAPDVICLGSQGHSAMAETLLGSVARAVMAQNSQPVLLVRPAPP